MAIQRKTREIIESMVSRKQNFNRGNVSGKWVDRNYFGHQVAMLPQEFVKVLREHNKNTDLFVLYSYDTPMAWFRLGDSDSQGNNKWYYVDHKYSVSTTQHQHAYRMALKGENVVTLTRIFDNAETGVEVAEMEKEFF